MRVVDLSHHDKLIDFKRAKAAGIDGAIIRCGYGVSGKDRLYLQQITKAITQGMPVGIYYFSYAYTPAMAKAEGERCVKLIEKFRKWITMPVFFDWEYDSYDRAVKNGVKPTGKLVTDMHRAFLDVVKAAGYREGIYFNQDYIKRGLINPDDFPEACTWYARYTKTKQKKYDLWQYTETGKIDGISGEFDLSEVIRPEKVFVGKQPKPAADPKPAKEKEATKIVDVKTKMQQLQRGAEGKAVRIWQQICGAKVDGDFGAETEKKTREYQQRYALKVDGIVGSRTWAVGLEKM